MGGSMNILIGLSFIYGTANLAYSLGAVLIALQLIVISTHFCMAWEALLHMVTPSESSCKGYIYKSGWSYPEPCSPASPNSKDMPLRITLERL